jgi:hypothetical protein
MEVRRRKLKVYKVEIPYSLKKKGNKRNKSAIRNPPSLKLRRTKSEIRNSLKEVSVCQIPGHFSLYLEGLFCGDFIEIL